MNGKPRQQPIPIPIHNFGGQKAIELTELDTIESKCKACGGTLFDVAYRHRMLPAISPKNPSGKDMGVKIETFICRVCGTELGKELVDEKKR